MGEEEKILIARLETKLEMFMKTTLEYRDNLSGQIKDIFYVLSHLPCDKRTARYATTEIHIKLLWLASGVIFGILVAHLGWK